MNGAGMPDAPGDSFMGYDFVIPGILLMEISSFPVEPPAAIRSASRLRQRGGARRDAGHGREGVRRGQDHDQAQQRVIDARPGARIMPTAHDHTVTMFNAKVAKLARGNAMPVLEAAA